MFKYILIFSLVAIILGDKYPFHSRWEGKIVGGTETTIEKCPYQVSLQYITTHICGASIITSNTILTAAHCVYGKGAESLSVVAGTSRLYNISDPGQRYFIDKILIHEQYNSTSQNCDIALLKTNRPIKFSPKIRPVELQPGATQIPPFTAATVSGWGATKEGGHTPTPAILRQATVAVMHTNVCISKYGTLITPSMLCAQTAGRDACQGDSGGPLVLQNKQIGIVSWGFGCARPPYPGVYTNISYIRPWIDAHKNWY